jgi:hypothetical protein
MDTESWQKIRAIRRHHRNRIILKRYEKVQRGHWYVKNPGYLGKNNIVCSCWMCGNPRKYFRQLTVQERKANLAWPINYGALSLEI